MSFKRNIRGINGQERMDGKVTPVPFEPSFKVPSKLWKKKYKCKKNKGNHTFEVAVIKHTAWKQAKDGTWLAPQHWWDYGYGSFPYWVEWHCSACKKHDYEYRKLDKKFDKFRPTTWGIV